jgi:hypothetical protein
LLGSEARQHSLLALRHRRCEGDLDDAGVRRQEASGRQARGACAIQRMLDDPRRGAALPIEEAAGSGDGPGERVMVGVAAFVGRSDDGVGLQLAKRVRDQGRQLRQAMSTLLVHQSERDRAGRGNASNVKGLQQLVAPGGCVGLAIGEAVRRCVGHVARSAVRRVNDPHVAETGEMSTQADGLVIGVGGEANHSIGGGHGELRTHTVHGRGSGPFDNSAATS